MKQEDLDILDDAILDGNEDGLIADTIRCRKAIDIFKRTT